MMKVVTKIKAKILAPDSHSFATESIWLILLEIRYNTNPKTRDKQTSNRAPLQTYLMDSDLFVFIKYLIMIAKIKKASKPSLKPITNPEKNSGY